MTYSKRVTTLMGVLTLLALAPASHAQQPASAPVPEKEKAVTPEVKKPEQTSDDDVLMLSPFEVQSDKSNDYVASESVTGTRVASKLRDLPFQVNVVTAEFMADFATFDMSQQLGWVSNISPSDTQGNLVLRGFSVTPYVDGFRRIGNISIVDTARVEIIKGPSASIYGQTLPGGVVNYVSKRPKATQQDNIDVTVGSDRFFRTALSSSGPVAAGSKLLYMVNLSTSSRDFEQQYASQQQKTLSAMFQYNLSETTNFTIKVADQLDHNRDRTAVPWVKSSTSGFLTQSDGVTPLKYTYITTNPLTGVQKTSTANVPYPQVIIKYTNNPDDVNKLLQYIANPSAYGTNGSALPLSAALNTTNSWDRIDTSLKNVRSDGILGYNESNLKTMDITAEHRTTDWLSQRFSFDLYQRPYERQYVSGNQVYYTDPNYPDGELGLSTPTWQITPQRGYSSQLDSLFTFDTGPVSHKFLVTFDFTHQEKRSKSVSTASSGSYSYVDPTTGNTVSGTVTNDKYLVTDPVTGIQYPYVIPLGPRSTGTWRYVSTSNSYTTNNAQELAWPYDTSNYYYPTYAQHPESYINTSTDMWQASDDYGIFMSERATFFKGRLIAMIGGRYDYMVDLYKNYLGTTSKARRTLWDDQALTFQTGVTGYITKNIVAFANKSTAYNPNMQVVNVRNTDPSTGAVTYSPEILPNESGRGYEFGVRFNLFHERLNMGVSRFVIDRFNKVDSYTDEYGISEYVGQGTQRSKGYEIDYNWAVTDSLQILGGYGYNDARYTYSTLPYLIGTTTPQNSKDNINLAVRYQFKNSMLKGLSFTAGVRYYSKSLINIGSGSVFSTNPYSSSFKPLLYNTPMYSGALPFPSLPANVAILSSNCSLTTEPTGAVNPKTGLALTNGNANKGYTSLNIPSGWVQYTPGMTLDPSKQYYIIDGDGSTSASYKYTTSVDDGRANVYNEPYAIYNVGTSYNFKVGRHYSHTLRFNVENLTNKFYTYGNGVYGYAREYKFTYSLAF